MERNDITAEAEKGDPAWYHDINLEHAEKFISENLKAAARNVIAIGYYLKYIRDNKLYEGAGYQNIWDYARDKYGFSTSTASRYMSRNDKFSKGGNSPIMDERYREYGKSQLQEMLSLDAEQLDQVTPDMTAREIRRLRRSKESDFVEGPADSPEPEKDESIATSQKQEEKPENQKYGGCPDGITCCPRNEWGTTPEEQEAGRKECRKCWEQYEKRQSVLDGSSGQQLHTEDMRREDAEKEKEKLQSGPTEEEVIDAEFTETEEETLSDLDLLKDILKSKNKLLDSCLRIDGLEEASVHIRKMKLEVAALASMICDLENVPETLDEPEQPELPTFKNNDERKSWLNDYAAWGIWYEDEHIGARYYKYDFPDGTRLIVDEYRDTLPNGRVYKVSYLHLVGGPKERPKTTYGAPKWPYHDRYRRHPDNMTDVVEFLKDQQKQKRK